MNNEIITVRAGKRTYFFDVKQTVNGSKYISVTESKKIEDNFERHQVIIFEEDVHNFIQAFMKAFQTLQTSEVHVEKSKMEKTKEKYVNAYNKWTEEEDNLLTELFCQGKKPKEISSILRRNTGAITSRIDKLELKEKYGR